MFWKEKNDSAKLRMYLLVAFTGGAILAIETLAFRVLSPFFGNTIYSFSSIITVVLGALSLGYLKGGVLADRGASYQEFFKIIFWGGATTLLFFSLADYLLPIIFLLVPSLVWGPLIGSFIIFFVPAFVLGMLSPYAVTLLYTHFPEDGIGHISGRTFAWSTAGSILGSLLTGFYLIPYIGISTAAIGISASLMWVAVFGYWKTSSSDEYKKVWKFSLIAIVVLAFSILIFMNSSYKPVQGKVLFEEDGVYEKVGVYETNMYGQPIHLLVLDRSPSSAINPITGALVFPYTKYFDLYNVVTSEPERTLILGGGSATVAKSLHDTVPMAHVDVVDIEPLLPELSRTYFGVPDSDRITYHIEDARRFLLRSDETYDYIFSDIYSSIYSIPSHVMTQEFFMLLSDRLTNDGVAVFNFIGSLQPEDDSFILSAYKTLQAVFPVVEVFAVNDPDSYQIQNIMFFVSNQELEKPFKTLLLNNEKLAKKARYLVDMSPYMLNNQVRYTDNYAPVERHTSKLLQKRPVKNSPSTKFNGKNAYDFVRAQVALGPRALGTGGHQRVQKLIIDELKQSGIAVSLQTWNESDSDNESYEFTNILGRLNPDKTDRILLGTHYDSKMFADQDSVDPTAPVPGANDSASGVAVLLELARVMERNSVGVDFVFFDGEEGFPNMKEGEWRPIGSQHFVSERSEFYPMTDPKFVGVVDMVCDKDLKIYAEESSLKYGGAVYRDFLEHAVSAYPSYFTSKVKYHIRDDHTPFGEAGIPAFVIIDYDYPAFHTREDTLDKCSASSLQVVGTTLESFVKLQNK